MKGKLPIEYIIAIVIGLVVAAGALGLVFTQTADARDSIDGIDDQKDDIWSGIDFGDSSNNGEGNGGQEGNSDGGDQEEGPGFGGEELNEESAGGLFG
jgi:hypothetical protein